MVLGANRILNRSTLEDNDEANESANVSSRRRPDFASPSSVYDGSAIWQSQDICNRRSYAYAIAIILGPLGRLGPDWMWSKSIRSMHRWL